MKVFDSIEELKKFDWSDNVQLIGINDYEIRLRNNITIILDNSSPIVEAYGSSSPRIEAYGSSSPTVVAYDNSSPRIEAYGSSSPTVEANGSSSPIVEANGNSRVIHNGHKINVKCFANSLFITQSKEYTPDPHIIIQPNYNIGEDC
jgi:hypothetical protein